MIIVILAILGLIFGSFVNAFVWRLHKQELLRGKSGKKTQQELKKLSITTGRSMCSSCGHELAPKDLVPILSWLWLRGKCRYCHVRIEDSPLVELVTSSLFVISFIFWPLTLHSIGIFQFIVWLIFIVAFMCLAVYDLRWFLLPDKVVFPLIAIALVQIAVVTISTTGWSVIWEPFLGAFIISGLFYALFKTSDGKWIGGGDVKLAVVLGLLAGSPLRAILIIFFASLVGTVLSLPLLLKSSSNLRAKVPFGPFLLFACVVVVLFGERIVSWYTKILL